MVVCVEAESQLIAIGKRTMIGPFFLMQTGRRAINCHVEMLDFGRCATGRFA